MSELPIPSNYRGPQNQVESSLVYAIFKLIFGNSATASGRADVLIRCNGEDCIIAMPSIFDALRILASPSVASGDLYVKGKWFLRMGSLARFASFGFSSFTDRYKRYFACVREFKGLNHYAKQKLLVKRYTRQVREHYDLDSTLYELMLDGNLYYTCALFENDGQSLEEAQKNKTMTVLRRLELPEGNVRVLDIGCGWGALDRELVRSNKNAVVTGISISQNQIAWAQSKLHCSLSAQEADRVEYFHQDYADHARTNYYDGVTVVGMMEHVGLGDYKLFLARINEFLKPSGKAVIHTIVCERSNVPANKWIDKHIFPGAYVPSIGEVVLAAEGTIKLMSVHTHGPHHYERTLRLWKANFLEHMSLYEAHLSKNGYSKAECEEFIRKWHFYLSSCEAMFSSNYMGYQIAHFVMEKL